jgi:hypothetical protein
MEGKMKQTSKALSVILTTLFLIVVFSSVSFAVDRKPVASPTTGMKVVQQPAPNLEICKDPAVKNFNVTKTLSGNVATFTMTGQVCNNGPGNYNQPGNNLEAHFNVYTGYGPQFSYPASGETKFFTQTVGPVLNNSQCMSFTQTFTRNKVLHWGFPSPAAAPKPNEKPMKLLFEFFVRDAKGSLGTSSQPKSLDCNTGNNLLSQTYEMTVSTQ